MRPRAVARRGAGASQPQGGTPPRWRTFVWASVAGWLAVGLVAGVTWLMAPASLREIPDRSLPDDLGVIVSILVNNLLIATIPMFGGLIAARHLAAGRRPWAWLALAPAAIIVAKAVAVVGIVGGLDPDWLVRAIRWWAFEIAAIAVSAHSGLWLARHPRASARLTEQVVRRALLASLPAVAIAAVVEVLTA